MNRFFHFHLQKEHGKNPAEAEVNIETSNTDRQSSQMVYRDSSREENRRRGGKHTDFSRQYGQSKYVHTLFQGV